jgi:hypothetical protein
MTSPAEPETSERYLAIARRWFAEGWSGNLAMAGEASGDELDRVEAGVVKPC